VPPGGSMGLRYVLQFLFQWKITELLITQQQPKLDKKMSTDLESLEFYNIFDVCLTKFKNNLILFDKISHIFQLTMKLFLLGERAS
jgi:hypothetical protein